MKIELKNVKQFGDKRTGHVGFSAIVYLDGVKSGQVYDDGWGGGNSYENDETWQKLNAYGKTLPPDRWSSGGKEYVTELDADILIGKALDEYLAEKELRNGLKKRLMYVSLDGKSILQSKTMPPEHLKHFTTVGRSKLGDDFSVLLNEIPFEEALKKYVEVTCV
jgi:hypothetical protein